MPVNSLMERIRHYSMPEGTVECRGTWLRQVGEMHFVPSARGSLSARRFPLERVGPNGASDSHSCRRFLRPRHGAIVRLGFRLHSHCAIAGSCNRQGRGYAWPRRTSLEAVAFGEVPPLAWEALEGDKLLASFNDWRTQAAVVFDVDREERVLGGIGSERPRLVGKSVVETGWSGSFGNYRVFDGVRIPTAAEAIWHPPEGPSHTGGDMLRSFAFSIDMRTLGTQ